MYVPFQDATLLPVTINAGEFTSGTVTLPRVDAVAAKGRDGKVWLSLTNLDPNNAADVSASGTAATGEVLTAERVDSINTYEAPTAVTPKPFSAKAEAGSLVLHLPPHSVTVVHLEP